MMSILHNARQVHFGDWSGAWVASVVTKILDSRIKSISDSHVFNFQFKSFGYLISKVLDFQLSSGICCLDILVFSTFGGGRDLSEELGIFVLSGRFLLLRSPHQRSWLLARWDKWTEKMLSSISQLLRKIRLTSVHKSCHHTCKKRGIVGIYPRNFFWIFRKILGWEREINSAQLEIQFFVTFFCQFSRFTHF